MTLYMSLRTSYEIVYDMGIDGANIYPVRDPEEMGNVPFTSARVEEGVPFYCNVLIVSACSVLLYKTLI